MLQSTPPRPPPRNHQHTRLATIPRSNTNGGDEYEDRFDCMRAASKTQGATQMEVLSLAECFLSPRPRGPGRGASQVKTSFTMTLKQTTLLRKEPPAPTPQIKITNTVPNTPHQSLQSRPVSQPPVRPCPSSKPTGLNQHSLERNQDPGALEATAEPVGSLLDCICEPHWRGSA